MSKKAKPVAERIRNLAGPQLIQKAIRSLNFFSVLEKAEELAKRDGRAFDRLRHRNQVKYFYEAELISVLQYIFQFRKKQAYYRATAKSKNEKRVD